MFYLKSSTLNPENLYAESFNLIGLFFVGTLFQVSMHKAVKLEKNTSLVSIIMTSSVIFGFLSDLVLFGDEFKWYKLAGSLVVMLSIAVIILTKNK